MEENTAIQLELYRQTVKVSYPDKEVAGVGYYLMPMKQLFTADFAEIANRRLIKKVQVDNTSDLFELVKNSYAFRMEEIRKGHIEEAEMMDISEDAEGYYQQTNSEKLCPLAVTEKTEGRGTKKEVVGAVKDSEPVFKPSQKFVFDKANASPSETATSHSILKGRLK